MTARQLRQRLKQAEDEWSALVFKWRCLWWGTATPEELDILSEYAARKRASPEEIKSSPAEIAIAQATWQTLRKRFEADCSFEADCRRRILASLSRQA